MKLLLALALALSSPADAGKKKQARQEQEARLESERLQTEAMQLLAQQQYDDPRLETLIQGALQAHPEPPADLWLLDLQWRMVRSSPDLDGAAASLRKAMSATGQAPMVVGNVVFMGTKVALLRAYQAPRESDDAGIPEAAVADALALLDELDAYAIRLGSDRFPVLAARIDLLANAFRPAREQLTAVDAALELRPDVSQLWVVKSQLHEQLDQPEPATAAIDKALELAPADRAARYQAAALYINRSVALRQQANDLSDVEQADALMGRADALHAQARPHLEAVHTADPTDVEAIRQLMTLAIAADDTAAYQAYKAKLDALQGG